LWQAIESGDLEAVASCLQEDRDLVNIPHEATHHFPITYLAEKQDLPMIQYFVMSNALVNAPGELRSYQGG